MLGRTHGLWWSAAARYLNTAPVWRCGASWLPWQLTHLPQGVDIIKLPNACHSLGVLGELVALAGIGMGAITHTHTLWHVVRSSMRFASESAFVQLCSRVCRIQTWTASTAPWLWEIWQRLTMLTKVKRRRNADAMVHEGDAGAIVNGGADDGGT